MKALTSKKAIIGILSLSSIVLAGTIKDYRSHSVASYENATATEEIIPVERSVASEEVSKAAQMYLPMNAENSVKINGVWEITRIVGSDEKVAFDKAAHAEDAKKSIKVEFKLVGTSLVQVGKKGEGLVYNVSLLRNNRSI
jgi:hypothetical protein